MNDGKDVKVVHSGGPGGAKYAYWGGGKSIVDLLTPGGYTVWMGKLDPVYEMLELTDEQKAAMEKLAAELRDEVRKLQQETHKLFVEKRDYAAWTKQQEKIKELTATYDARMKELLTDEQRELVKKIQEIAEKKREMDAKIREVMNLAFTKNREDHEAALKKALTPEQMKRLEEATKAKPFTRRRGGRRGGGGGRDRGKPGGQETPQPAEVGGDELF